VYKKELNMKNRNLFARGKKAALLALVSLGCVACYNENAESYAHDEWTQGDDIAASLIFDVAVLGAAGYGAVKLIKTMKNKRNNRER
jgi:hypothetical protein